MPTTSAPVWSMRRKPGTGHEMEHSVLAVTTPKQLSGALQRPDGPSHRGRRIDPQPAGGGSRLATAFREISQLLRPFCHCLG